MNKKGKIIVISAPSGCGKSTIINSILGSGEIQLRFSVSATNRAPRPGEEDGVPYHLFPTEEFRDAIASDAFVEWEQAYPGRYSGTEALRQRLIKRGTDSAEVIAERIGKAEYEMSFAPQFDRVIVNDDLPVAVAATESAISDFINK